MHSIDLNQFKLTELALMHIGCWPIESCEENREVDYCGWWRRNEREKGKLCLIYVISPTVTSFQNCYIN
jgi:hypothetical protein